MRILSVLYTAVVYAAPVKLVAILLLAAAWSGAHAQGMEFYAPLGGDPGDSGFDNAQQQRAEPRLRAALGVGAGISPRYPGSDAYRAHVFPAIHLAYGPVFFGIGGLGMNLYRAQGWRVGVNVMPSRGRDESDDPHLRGLGDVDRTVRGGAFAVYYREGYLARFGVSTDIGGNHQGTVVRFDVYARRPLGEGVVLFAGPGLTWADRNYTQTFFGVTAAQSAASGLPQFDAGAGVASARLSAGAIYRLAPRWRLLSSYSYSRLTGDAGSSPITENRNQHFVAVSAVYLLR